MTLTNHERSLIKNSWALLKAEAGISNHLVFYDSFFTIAPEAQKYFKKKNGDDADFKKLTRKFTYTMDFIVGSIDNLEEIPTEISDLGSLHNRLKIDPKYYPLFNQSMIMLLDELLGARCTDEVRAAWTKVLEFITEKMQAAPMSKANSFQKLLNKLFGNH